MRQVIGLAEKLAANDPERFVWAMPKTFKRYAKKRNGAIYGERQVFYSLVVLRSLDILRPARRNRSGVLRKGYIVKLHDATATREGKKCHLQSQITAVASAVAFEDSASASAGLNAAIAVRGCSQQGTFRPPDVSDPERLGASRIAADKLVRVPLTQSTQSALLKRAQITQSKSKSNKGKETRSLASSDLTMTRTGKGNEGCCVADRITVRACGDHRLLELISDGVFQPRFLDSYQYRPELMQCCRTAVEELRQEPFEGRNTNARIMGRAMELLRSLHKMDAPKGWVVVMKKLRQEEAEVIPAWASLPPLIVPPKDIFTAGGSSIRALDSTIADKLQSEPQIRDVFFQVAERRGVPQGWNQEAVDFLDEVLASLPVACIDVNFLRGELLARIQDYNQSGQPD